MGNRDSVTLDPRFALTRRDRLAVFCLETKSRTADSVSDILLFPTACFSLSFTQERVFLHISLRLSLFLFSLFCAEVPFSKKEFPPFQLLLLFLSGHPSFFVRRPNSSSSRILREHTHTLPLDTIPHERRFHEDDEAMLSDKVDDERRGDMIDEPPPTERESREEEQEEEEEGPMVHSAKNDR